MKMTAAESADNIIRAFERAASMKPGKILIAGEKTLTYGELLKHAALLTSLFRKGGLSPGDRAVISTVDDIAAVTFFLSLLRSGVTAVIIDPETPAPQAQALISAARPKAVFLDSGICGSWQPDKNLFTVEIKKTGGRDSLFDKLIKKKISSDNTGYPAVLDTLSPAATPPDIHPGLSAYVIFTSGTTSRPRGVEISHGSLFHHLCTLSRQFGYDKSSRIMNVLPLHHADGLIQGPVVAFFNGCSVHRPMPFTVQNIHGLLDNVYSERITHLVAVPTMLSLIHRFADGYEDCFVTEDFRFIISTAAYLDEGLWRNFEDRFKTRIANVYGLTETVAGSLFSGPGDKDHRIGTIGRPVDCAARIVDESGRAMPAGSAGELAISGSHLMKGYLGDPEATSEALKDGWLLTGDIAVADNDGFYRIAGRKKNVIISGGINVHPEEVSEVLKAHPSVIDAVTFGVNDEVRGERIISCVTLSSGNETGTQNLVDFCRTRLAPSKAPERVHILPELPKGPSGKIIIDRVRQMVTDAAPRVDENRGRDIRSRVFSAAARSFRLPPSDITLNSNASNTPGWDSLGHIEFAASLEEEFDIALATVDILNIRSLLDAERIIGAKYLNR